MMLRKNVAASMIALCMCYMVVGHAVAHVEIRGAFVRGLPPGQPNTAAFMTVENDTTADIVLVGATTSAAKIVEMHQHKHVDGMMQMRQVHTIELAAGSKFLFSPGGYHIMLIGLTTPLRHGDTIDFELNFASGAKRLITIPVRSVLKENDE